MEATLDGSETQGPEVKTYGGVQLDYDERLLLQRQPEYALGRQGDLHTLNDRRVEWEEVERVQARLNNLSRSLTKVFGIGEDKGDKNTARCWRNVSSDSCVVPILYPCPKVHKPVGEDEDPKTRPVVCASSCITSRPGEILADNPRGHHNVIQCREREQEYRICLEPA